VNVAPDAAPPEQHASELPSASDQDGDSAGGVRLDLSSGGGSASGGACSASASIELAMASPMIPEGSASEGGRKKPEGGVEAVGSTTSEEQGGAAQTSASPARSRAPLLPPGERKQVVAPPPWVDFPDGAIQAVAPRAMATAADSEAGETVIYFIGVIDILTRWTCAKSMENLGKTLMHPTRPNAHSCVPPPRYAGRFEKAMRRWLASPTESV